ncbi:hypothetical protein [Sphingobacterium sp. SGR-19]|uniref:hypothetical protein n=1 Tax=Sphingobacterium sp. SGR-19 TaxID=2710886 RepID=UPI0013E9C597|nr:hypothetical protein [Sphingobacterium sp. SGR-19]NGM64077.1 hypothetical protein [Sphingobacterium sp. SGR-19]
MEEQNNILPPNITESHGGSRTENGKLNYIAPTMGSILVELESNIAAGSITLKETDEEVQESWKVEDDIIKDIEIDLF